MEEQINIFSYQETTIDYPGKMGIIVFIPGCNFRCGFCHNAELREKKEKGIDFDIFFKNISARTKRGWYQGVCISGGEPTIHSDLPEFARKIKDLGLAVKLDTNGSNPEAVKKLLEEKLIDYVAMDVKAPPQLYSQVIGNDIDLKIIEESMRILSNSGINYEFRTTIGPIYDESNIRWMRVKEAVDIAKWIKEITGKKDCLYFLQRFVARDIGEMMDIRFSKEKLEPDFHETPEGLLLEMEKEAQKYLVNVRIR
jgi:pyruvate formate lyase activating enzyme